MGFHHITSSPRYPQSNGFIERQIQTVKNTLDKAEKSGKDLSMSMLCLRPTPIDSQLPSPAELLYQRKLKSNLPIRIRNEMPNRDEINQRLTERQESMKYYHDRNAQDLNPLKTGQHVFVQNQSTKKWVPGTVKCKRPEFRSYEVQTESGSTLRRNRRHLRPVGELRDEVDPKDENTVSASEDSSVDTLPSIIEPTDTSDAIVTPCPLNGVTSGSEDPAVLPEEICIEPY